MPEPARLRIDHLQEHYCFELAMPSDRGVAVITGKTPMSVCAPADITVEIEKLVGLLHQLAHRDPLHAYDAPSALSGAPSDDQLISLGRLLYAAFPKEIRQALRALDGPLLLTTTVPEVPWELAHDGITYLCFSHLVGRTALLEQPREEKPRAGGQGRMALLIADPTEELPNAREGAEVIYRLLMDEMGTRVVPVVRDRGYLSRVRGEFASAEYDLIHYAGHSMFDADSGEAALCLNRGEMMTCRQIVDSLAGRPIVFLNSCRSADSIALQDADTLAVGMRGLAAAFVQGGARAVIGTFWPIPDRGSYEFACEVYREALRGQSIGGALHAARHKAWRAGDPRWACYTLYGDPRLALVDTPRVIQRPATAMSVRLVGVDALYQHLTNSEATRCLGELWAAIEACVAQHDGSTYGTTPDALLAVFAVSERLQNDAQRALNAALALREAVAQVELVVSLIDLRIGIGSGDVHLVQPDPREPSEEHSVRQPTAMGEPVSRALHLSQQAGEGDILVDQLAQRLGRSTFDLQPLELYAAPDEPSYRVLGPLPEARRTWRRGTHTPALVGRQIELLSIRDTWENYVHAGERHAIGIRGTAGMGKSRLLHEARCQLDAVWIHITCSSVYHPREYELVTCLVDALCGTQLKGESNPRILEALLQRLPLVNTPDGEEESRAIVAHMVGLSVKSAAIRHLDERQRRSRLASILWQLLMAQSQEGPFVLAIDDIHLADKASIAVLDELLQPIYRNMPMLLLYAYRLSSGWEPPWQERDRCTGMLSLKSFSERESRQMLAHLLDVEAVSDELARAVLPQTEQTPIFVQELVEWLRETEQLVFDGAEWKVVAPARPIPITGTIDRLIWARVEALSEPARTLLALAAVVGHRFEGRLLEQALPADARDGLQDVLTELVNSALLYIISDQSIDLEHYEELEYDHIHDIVQEIVYQHLTDDVRAQSHRQVAEAMRALYSDEDVLEKVAHHYCYGDHLHCAAKSALRAAQRARARWAYADAVMWCDRALERLERLDRLSADELRIGYQLGRDEVAKWQVDALETKASAQAATGHNDKAISLYGQALGVISQQDVVAASRRADLYWQLAKAHHDGGDLDHAARALEKGLRALGDAPCIEAGRIHIWLGLILYRRGQLAEGLRACERGLEMVAGEGSDLAMGHNLRGLILNELGHTDDAIAAHERSIRLYKKVGDRAGLERAYSNQGCNLQDAGEWGDALAQFQESERLSARNQEPWRQGAAAINLGEIHRRLGQLAEAVDANQAALALGERFDLDEVQGMAHMNLGALHLYPAIQDPGTARRELERAGAIFEASGADVYQPELLRHLAELALTEGDDDEAAALAHRALDRATATERHIEIAQAQRVLGRALIARGEHDEAETHLRQGLELMEEAKREYEVGLLLVEWARLHVARAADQPPPEEGDQVPSEEGDQALPKEATDALGRAIALFERLGAAADLARAREVGAAF